MAIQRQEFELDDSKPLYGTACPLKDSQTFDEAFSDAKEGSQIGRLARVFDNFEFAEATAESIRSHFASYKEKDTNFPEFNQFMSEMIAHKGQSPLDDKGTLQVWVEVALPGINSHQFSWLLDDILKIATSAILTQDNTLKKWLTDYFEKNRIKKAMQEVNNDTLRKLFIAGFTSRVLTALFHKVHEKNKRLVDVILYIINTQLSVSSIFLAEVTELREASKKNKELSASEDFKAFLKNIENTIKKIPRADTGKFLPLITLAKHVCTLAQSHPQTRLYQDAFANFQKEAKIFNGLIRENKRSEEYSLLNSDITKINQSIKESIEAAELKKAVLQLEEDYAISSSKGIRELKFDSDEPIEEDEKNILSNPLIEIAKKELQELKLTISRNDISTKYPGLKDIAEDFKISETITAQTIEEIKTVNGIITSFSQDNINLGSRRSSEAASSRSVSRASPTGTDFEHSPTQTDEDELEFSKSTDTVDQQDLKSNTVQKFSLDTVEQQLEKITTPEIKNSLIKAFNIVGREVTDIITPLEKKLEEKESQIGNTLWVLSALNYIPLLHLIPVVPDKEKTKKDFFALSKNQDAKSQKIVLYTLKTIQDSKFQVDLKEKEIRDEVARYSEELTRIRNPLWRSVYSFLRCFGVSTPHNSKTKELIVDACKAKSERIDKAIKYLK